MASKKKNMEEKKTKSTSKKAEKLKVVEKNKSGGYLTASNVEHKPIPYNQKFFLTIHEEINNYYKNKLEYLLPPIWSLLAQVILAIGLAGFVYVVFLVLALSGLFKTFGLVSLLPAIVLSFLIFAIAKYGMKGAVWFGIWEKQSSFRQYLLYMVKYDIDLAIVCGIRDLISAAPFIITFLLSAIVRFPSFVEILLLIISGVFALIVQALTFYAICPIIVEKKKAIDVLKNIGDLFTPFKKLKKESIYCMLLTAIGVGLLIVPILNIISYLFILPILYHLRCRIYMTSKKARGL